MHEGSDRAGYDTTSRPGWPGPLSWQPSLIFRLSANRGVCLVKIKIETTIYYTWYLHEILRWGGGGGCDTKGYEKN